MKLQFNFILIFSLITIKCLSQDITGFESYSENEISNNQLFDSIRLNRYFDSLKLIYPGKLLTGYTSTIYSEPASNCRIEYSVNNLAFTVIKSGKHGEFFIPIPEKINELHIRVADKEFHSFDTILKAPFISRTYLPLVLSPRYEIVLRGRIYVGSLATENVEVRIRHNTDTFNIKTLGCYTDSEDYWNCLYRGMFKQSINFDNPEDSVYVTFNKQGFLEQKLSLKVTDYDGTIIPVKLKFSRFLPVFPANNIALKYSPPFNTDWSIGLNYTRMLQIGNFNRLGVGLEAAMLFSNLTTNYNTFPNADSSAPQGHINAQADTTYNLGLIMPHVTFWLTKPDKRLYSIYAGIGFPYAIPGNKISLQPFLGGRVYLDINKALIMELRYVEYELDVVNYVFNPLGNAGRSYKSHSFTKLMFNFGLQVSF